MFKSLQHIWSEKVMYKLKIIIKNIRPLSSLGSQQNSWSFLSSVCVSQTTAGRSTTIRQSLEYKHFSKLRSLFENMHSVWTIAALEFFPDYISAEQSESVKRRSPSAKLDSALLSIWTINSSRPRCLWIKKTDRSQWSWIARNWRQKCFWWMQDHECCLTTQHTAVKG